MKYLITITLGLFLFLGIPSVCNAQIIKSKEAIKTKAIIKIKSEPKIKLEPKIILLRKNIDLIFPTNKAINVALNTTLSWEAEISANGNVLNFDVYFGTETDPTTKVSFGQTHKSYTPTLVYNTTYYWKVVITDSTEETDKSVVWSFKTDPGIIWSDDSHGTYTDQRDANVYNVLKIGEQVWFAENLAYLPEITPYVSTNTGRIWGSEILDYYVYDYRGNDIELAKSTFNYQTYGVLYNWDAAMNRKNASSNNPSGVRGACPCGWHVPSYEEWIQLKQYIYNNGEIAGNMIGKALASKTIWDISGESAGNVAYRPTNNSTGFTALPSGYGKFYPETFSGYLLHQDMGEMTHFWTTSEGINESSALRISFALHKTLGSLNHHETEFINAYSVRCVKD